MRNRICESESNRETRKKKESGSFQCAARSRSRRTAPVFRQTMNCFAAPVKLRCAVLPARAAETAVHRFARSGRAVCLRAACVALDLRGRNGCLGRLLNRGRGLWPTCPFGPTAVCEPTCPIGPPLLFALLHCNALPHHVLLLPPRPYTAPLHPGDAAKDTFFIHRSKLSNAADPLHAISVPIALPPPPPPTPPPPPPPSAVHLARLLSNHPASRTSSRCFAVLCCPRPHTHTHTPSYCLLYSALLEQTHTY